MVSTKRLNGSTVVLEGRTRPGSTWVAKGRAKVKAGEYTVGWTRQPLIRALRVRVLAYDGLAPSPVVAVKVARISDCDVRRTTLRRVVTCHTTAKDGTRARLIDGKRVLDRAKVHQGLVTVSSRSSLAGKRLTVYPSQTRRVSLRF